MRSDEGLREALTLLFGATPPGTSVILFGSRGWGERGAIVTTTFWWSNRKWSIALRRWFGFRPCLVRQ